MSMKRFSVIRFIILLIIGLILLLGYTVIFGTSVSSPLRVEYENDAADARRGFIAVQYIAAEERLVDYDVDFDESFLKKVADDSVAYPHFSPQAGVFTGFSDIVLNDEEDYVTSITYTTTNYIVTVTAYDMENRLSSTATWEENESPAKNPG